MTTNQPDPDPGAAWRANADRIARWYAANLVVRTDRYGYHKARSRAVSAGPLTPEAITAHVHARTRSDVIGGLTVVEVDGVCYGKETALDIDAHRCTPEQITANEAAAVAWYGVLVGLGYDPLLTSECPGSYHLRMIHKQLQESRNLQALGRWLCADWAARAVCPGATGAGPEVYPKQYRLTGKRCGNWLRWPGKHHTRDAWSRVWDGSRWLEGSPAVDYMLNLRVADRLYLPPDFDFEQYASTPTKRKRRRKVACRDYVWPDDVSPAGRVVGKLLGGETPSDAEFLGLVPEARAVAKYLSRVAVIPDRVPMLIAYPVAVVDEHYNYTSSPRASGCTHVHSGGYTPPGVAPPPGYKWVPPADPAKVDLVERVLDALPPPAYEPEWTPRAARVAHVVTQSGTPTWVTPIPKGKGIGRGLVDFDTAAQTFDLATYLGLTSTGGKVLCPAHADTNPSLSVYHAHGRWHYRCWACGVHGDSIAYLAHTHNISRYEAARKILSKGARFPKVTGNPVARPPAYTNPAWQFTVVEIINHAHSELTSASGREARAYLHSRGLDAATIGAYRLGWNRRTVVCDEVEDWPQGLIIPRGIVIPWLLPGQSYADRYDPNADSPVYAGFNVRLVGYPNLSDPPLRQNGDPAPKYLSAQGSTRIYPYPYSTLGLPGRPLLVLEGEFDALLATRALGDRFNVATWCSATSDPAKVHVPDEFKSTPWYLLFDADPAGRAAALAWREAYPDAVILAYPPGVKDFGELYKSQSLYNQWVQQLV